MFFFYQWPTFLSLLSTAAHYGALFFMHIKTCTKNEQLKLKEKHSCNTLLVRHVKKWSMVFISCVIFQESFI